MNKFSRTVRSVTFAAIVGLSLGVASPGMVAQAEGVLITDVNEVAGNSPLVNKGAKGKLTIEKYGDPSELGDPTGTAADKPMGHKVPGATFKVYKVNQTVDGKSLDITTNEGLANAADIAKAKRDGAKQFLSGNQAKPELIGSVLTEVGGGSTAGKRGEYQPVVLEQLGLGVYLVVETETPEGYDGAAPFLAFIPMTAENENGQGTYWNYDVHAYPKNYKNETPTKTVDDKGKNVGDNDLIYTVTAPVRMLPRGEKYTQFKVTDQIDEKLTIKEVTVSAEGLKEDQQLEQGDYKTAPYFTGQNVSVELTESGLNKLQRGAKVTVKIKTTVNPKLNSPSDVAPNTARVFQNKPGGEQDSKGTPTPTVKTYWGGVQFTKVDSAGKELDGAAFQVLRIPNNMTCKNVDTKNKDAFAKYVVNGQEQGQTKKEFTGNKGKFLITGLHVNDFVDNEEVSFNDQDSYCLVETKAPKGKELLAEALPFNLMATGVTEDNPDTKDVDESVREYKPATVTVGAQGDGKVVNLDDTTPNLPMTGGAGVGILAAIGAAIIGAGAWFARRNSAES
ncbi:isopeptide-forming domain-containing fimbrial protein [Corynebacterium diphtheriae]|uniref:SpaH/EbpB family LPXTG-anchored major pilin n=1 Tax=Corynebacterium diphtheriae TaxID=1717 RepID=UPI0013C97762|nr:SpaH/EbpB family LPXTG-anchored major pilin [Corynebacterium diphtheriae]CAB0533730.1 isopeptide-forming domain-containing fimbrial protein [Corynebacterium diphtheriae]CAB0886204.1 isopeptide-forming domain-containing fimbrial protein [Corynebacterium diphtheriae]CAB0934703.1 isopeptide-forming domain-containing fimbrial protein [Corynebacterium diphtheriae]